jgi:glycosyltransferase involved in cell wall biosynthesis
VVDAGVKPGTVAVGFLDPGEWSACFGLSLLELLLADAHGPRRLVPNGKLLRKHSSAGGLVAARNEVATQTLDVTECEWLFLVDSDMGFAPDTVERLVAAADPEARPVVGGLCFKLHSEGPGVFHGEKYVILPTVFAWVEEPETVGFAPLRSLPDDTLLEVSATGAACLLVHRTVLEKVRARYGDHWFDPVTHPTGPTTFSEDLSFCVRLASLDIPVFVHTGVGTTHDKGGVFLDREAFDRQGLDADLRRHPEVIPA